MRTFNGLFYKLHVKNASRTYNKYYSTNAGSSQTVHSNIIGLSLFAKPVWLSMPLALIEGIKSNCTCRFLMLP